MIPQEKKYEVIQNPEGELLFGISVRDDEPENPRILYDGSKHALLYRKDNEASLLDYLPELAQKTLRGLKEVSIAEFTDDEEMVRFYNAPVHNLAKLPIKPSDLPK